MSARDVAGPSAGGLAGFCTQGSSLKEGGREIISLSPSIQNGELASLADALLLVGVYALSRAKRDQLAAELAGEGVAPEDLTNLRDYLFGCIEEASGKAQRTLASKLIEPFGRKDMFTDLRKHIELKRRTEAKFAPPPIPHMVNLPLGTPSCECLECVRWRSKHSR